MWWLGAEADDEELGTSALFFTLTTLLGLHIALIAEIMRKEFSFYHTCVALQFIALYTVLLGGHFVVDGRSRRTTKVVVREVGFAILFALFFGELCYATSVTASALEVAKACSTGSLGLNEFVLVYHNWVVLISVLVILPLFRYHNRWALQQVHSKLLRVGIYHTINFLSSLYIFVGFQFHIVGQFQRYMDPSENTWSFGQIVPMVALVALIFDIYRQANVETSGSGDEPRWRTWVVHGTSSNHGQLLISL